MCVVAGAAWLVGCGEQEPVLTLAGESCETLETAQAETRLDTPVRLTVRWRCEPTSDDHRFFVQFIEGGSGTTTIVDVVQLPTDQNARSGQWTCRVSVEGCSTFALRVESRNCEWSVDVCK